MNIENIKEITLASLDETVKKLNSLLTEDDEEKRKKIPFILEALTGDVETYNVNSRHKEYDTFLATDKPCFEALKQGNIQQVRLQHIQANLDNGTPEKYELSSFNKLVNLIEFNKYALSLPDGKTVFNRSSWMIEIEVLTKYLGMRILKEVEAEQKIGDVYEMSLDATNCGYKQPNPTSNNSLQTVCQYIVDGIIFEPTKEGSEENCFIFEKKDLKFLLLTMTRKGKKRTTLTMPRVSTITDLITEALHRIVNKKEWKLEG